jgi:hypothetical protein
MLLRGLRAAQVVENPACSPRGTTRRNPCLGGVVDYSCELGVTDVSLDGCLSADPVSVAGGVGAGGRDRGKRPLRNRCDVGGAGPVCWVVTRQILAVPTALMTRRTVMPTTLATP